MILVLSSCYNDGNKILFWLVLFHKVYTRDLYYLSVLPFLVHVNWGCCWWYVLCRKFTSCKTHYLYVFSIWKSSYTLPCLLGLVCKFLPLSIMMSFFRTTAQVTSIMSTKYGRRRAAIDWPNTTLVPEANATGHHCKQ